ncbi:NUDIX domain-containing protein [Streptomyces sp. NPDC056600]|uniref:NUDIX domain-containing protein n=1 Tax=Streptomyces sp. NPDC056600 TaxID=3345874 RepID=UPI003693164A
MTTPHRFIAAVWKRLRGSWQWRILHLANATFMVGVTGVVRDDAGRVLVLRHRLWNPALPWGLPTGFAKRGEEFGQTVVREVKEETGLDVRPGRLLRLRSGFRLRLEVAYEAELVGGELAVDDFEILEARWCDPGDLPEGLQPSHHELLTDLPRA